MFDIGWGELLVIGIVALIAIGPKELPGVLRTTGQWMGKIRRMASEFQDQFREAMREAEREAGMEDLKKKVDEMSDTTGNFTNFDPIGTVRKEFESLVGDDPTKSTTSSATTAPETTAPSAPPVPAETSEAAAPPAPQPEPTPEPTPQPTMPEPMQGRKAGEGA